MQYFILFTAFIMLDFFQDLALHMEIVCINCQFFTIHFIYFTGSESATVYILE